MQERSRVWEQRSDAVHFGSSRYICVNLTRRGFGGCIRRAATGDAAIPRDGSGRWHERPLVYRLGTNPAAGDRGKGRHRQRADGEPGDRYRGKCRRECDGGQQLLPTLLVCIRLISSFLSRSDRPTGCSHGCGIPVPHRGQSIHRESVNQTLSFSHQLLSPTRRRKLDSQRPPAGPLSSIRCGEAKKDRFLSSILQTVFLSRM
jgi:hypothetical protein